MGKVSHGSLLNENYAPTRVTSGCKSTPADVRPAPGELLSSRLHRLSHANGVPPRYFGAVLGASGENWSARFDRHLPEGSRRFLLDRTMLAPEELATVTLEPDPLSRLRLPLRALPQRGETPNAPAYWLQFCPTCLREDETPYFRRSWTLATRVSCFRHGFRLCDRCLSCGQGPAPFRRDRLVPQQYCAFCDAHLGRSTGPTSPGIRCLERLIDDLLRLHIAGQACAERKSLPEMLAMCPVPISSAKTSIWRVSHRARHDFFRRLTDGRFLMEGDQGGSQMKLWAQLAYAAPTHKGLVGAFTAQLARSVGLQLTSPATKPDLAALLRAATRLHAGRQFHDRGRTASYGADASDGADRPASASCSGSGRSRKLSSPKTARKVSVVTKV